MIDEPNVNINFFPIHFSFRTARIEKNLSFTLAKDKTKLEYISERQSLSLELVFGVELDLNSLSKDS